MKIIGIGANYVNDPADKEEKRKKAPMIFTKPDSSLLLDDADLEYPGAVSQDVWYEIEIAYRIGKQGKQIAQADALEYVDALALANDLTAKDVLKASRVGSKGPWALAKGFDGATPLGKFIAVSEFKDLNDINFSMELNGEEKQKGNTSLMIRSLEEIIEHVSAYMTLMPGDVILTGTPAYGVGTISPGDVMVGYLEGEKMIETKVV